MLIWFLSRSTVSITTKLKTGPVFLVLGSLATALTQYHDIIAPIVRGHMRGGDFGLSWVVAFVLMYCVIVPTRPRLALWSTLLAVSSVPLVYAVGVALGSNVRLTPATFFFSLIFPYIIVILLAYFGARVVYGLGKAVSQAREMGSYVLAELLGKGGMGEVWLATGGERSFRTAGVIPTKRDLSRFHIAATCSSILIIKTRMVISEAKPANGTATDKPS
jgi:hypothetical protein